MNPIALVSTYESGFQPLLVSTAGAQFLKRGITPDAYDVYLDRSNEWDIPKHSFVGISLALFDSLQGSIKMARKIKNINGKTHICFFGPYAYLNRERLLNYGDSVILGEWEVPLADAAEKVIDGKTLSDMDDVYTSEHRASHYNFTNREYRVPARHLLPSVRKYANPLVEKILNKKLIVGNVETSRGCHHGCQFCSVYAVYKKHVLFIDKEVILADVAQLAEQGIEHISFVDAEFINDINFSLSVVEAIHALYPHLTYDFTSRIDHIVAHKNSLETFKATGCVAITTSMEFPSAVVLDKVQKGITVSHIIEAMNALERVGIFANPTFVMFNPWVDLTKIMGLRNFIKQYGLDRVIDPVQYETKLHLFKGSALRHHPDIERLSLTEKEFHWEWKHEDERVERLYERMLQPPQEGEFKRCCLRC